MRPADNTALDIPRQLRLAGFRSVPTEQVWND